MLGGWTSGRHIVRHSVVPYRAVVEQAWLRCLVKIHAAIPILAINKEQGSTALAYRSGLTSGVHVHFDTIAQLGCVEHAWLHFWIIIF